jgi:hypothetical protein
MAARSADVDLSRLTEELRSAAGDIDGDGVVYEYFTEEYAAKDGAVERVIKVKYRPEKENV